LVRHVKPDYSPLLLLAKLRRGPNEEDASATASFGIVRALDPHRAQYAHGNGIHGVVPRNGENATSIRHDDVLALPDDFESGPFQGSDGPKVWYTGDFRHEIRRGFRSPADSRARLIPLRHPGIRG
jgi:hypothetical protein